MGPPATARVPPRPAQRIEVRQRGGDVVVEPERRLIIITPGQGVQLGHDDLTALRQVLMAATMDAQRGGARISCANWTRTRGNLTVEVQPRERSWSAQESGDNLIRLLHRQRAILPGTGAVIMPEAMWNTQLPRVAEFTARFPGTISEDRAREVIESEVYGLGVANSFPEAARRELRFLSQRTFEDGSGDTLIRFQGGQHAAREIQRRGGRVTLGCTNTTIQYNRAEITPDTIITLNLQM